MTVKLLGFDQALHKADNTYGKKHLLLGNGFSIACKPDIFAYGSLFEEAKKTMSNQLVAIFAAMGTQDFEEVIRALQHAAAIVSVYRPKFVTTKALLLAMPRSSRPILSRRSPAVIRPGRTTSPMSAMPLAGHFSQILWARERTAKSTR